MIRFYGYSGCGTCRKAKAWLAEQGLDYEAVAIRETPPEAADLERAMADFGRKRLFNTSGKDYREQGIKDRLASLDPAAVVALLRGNGNLVKRPFVVHDAGILVGFDAGEWAAALARIPHEPPREKP